MANVTTGNLLYFDSTTGAARTGELYVKGIFWTSYTGAGLDIAADDVFLLEETSGKDIIGKMAEAAGDGLELIINPPLRVDGVKVTTMGGGVCHIWLE